MADNQGIIAIELGRVWAQALPVFQSFLREEVPDDSVLEAVHSSVERICRSYEGRHRLRLKLKLEFSTFVTNARLMIERYSFDWSELLSEYNFQWIKGTLISHMLYLHFRHVNPRGKPNIFYYVYYEMWQNYLLEYITYQVLQAARTYYLEMRIHKRTEKQVMESLRDSFVAIPPGYLPGFEDASPELHRQYVATYILAMTDHYNKVLARAINFWELNSNSILDFIEDSLTNERIWADLSMVNTEDKNRVKERLHNCLLEGTRHLIVNEFTFYLRNENFICSKALYDAVSSNNSLHILLVRALNDRIASLAKKHAEEEMAPHLHLNIAFKATRYDEFVLKIQRNFATILNAHLDFVRAKEEAFRFGLSYYEACYIKNLVEQRLSKFHRL